MNSTSLLYNTNMNINVIAVLMLCTIALIGLINIIVGLYRLNERHSLLVKFTKKFIKMANDYFTNDSFSEEDYEWLLANVDEVNNMLGVVGTISYKPAYANYIHNNYQVLINTLPQFKSSLGVHHDDISFIESLLKRFAGVLGKTIKGQKSDLNNPMKWFSEGISFFLSLPLAFLESIGALSAINYGRAKSSKVFKAMVGIISAVSFMDAVYAIIAGHSFAVQFIQSIITKL